MFFRIINKLNSKKNFPYYIVTPLIYAIGDASEDISITALHAERLGKKILIFKTRYFQKFLRYHICNNALFDSLILNNQSNKRNFFYFIIDCLIQIEFILRRGSAIFFKKFFKIDLGETFRFSFLGIENLRTFKKTINYNQITPLSIKDSTADLEHKKKKECYKLLRSSGIKDKKFVCLHVRDNKYRNDIGRREYRNSDINNYIELIKLLISKDYYVFRMGDKPTPKLNFSNKQFIDYPYLDIKSELMDLFLIKECEFYVGTLSGTMHTAYLFNKPLLLTNMYELFSSFPRKKNDRGIFKKIIDKKTGEIINIKDFAKFAINYHHSAIDIEDIMFQENSEEELYNAMKEYLDFINKKNHLNNTEIQFDDIQVKFNEFLHKRLEEIYNEFFVKNNFFKEKGDKFRRDSFINAIKRFKSCEGTYNSSYLQKNF